ncbi:hypothetical protein O3M35_012349 [Rhynocoris fuscipes]|uniref:SHSP domain-containing protein n=1 Tax=Rhynocoris fuscipes TaxID=488301 RepID=A0AAW1CUK7_9HEMI
MFQCESNATQKDHKAINNTTYQVNPWLTHQLALFSVLATNLIRFLTKKPLLNLPLLKQIESKDVSRMPKLYLNNVSFTDNEGMVVHVDLEGIGPKNVTVRVEGPYLIVEGIEESVSKESGFALRHMVQQYEIPEKYNASNIKVNAKGHKLIITIPQKKM